MTDAEQTSSPLDCGRRYRLERLDLPLVLRGMYFSEDDPDPSNCVTDFDLPVLGGGRFRPMTLTMPVPLNLIWIQ